MYNRANECGGAMYLNGKFTISLYNSSNVRYLFNHADQYGGAVYVSVIHNIDSKITIDNTIRTNFKNNTASTGNNIYMDIPTSCDKVCRNKIILISITDTANHSFTNNINTLPNKLVLYDPVKCVHRNNDSDTNCDTYLITHIMLGQEIVIDAAYWISMIKTLVLHNLE